MSTLILPYPVTCGDSRLNRIVSRVSAAEAVVGRVSALVISVARSRPDSGDRTPLRLLAYLLVTSFASAVQMLIVMRAAVRPVWAWTITQRTVTSNRVSAAARTMWRAQAAHPLPCHAAAAESPAVFACVVANETRDSDKRDPAGNPGRHPRGRRTR